MLNFLSQHGLDFSSLVPAWMNNWFAHLQVAPGLLASQTYLPPFLVSIVLGTLLGMERRKRHKVAGVRTNMLVCAAACLITMVGLVVFDATKIGDPARLPGLPRRRCDLEKRLAHAGSHHLGDDPLRHRYRHRLWLWLSALGNQCGGNHRHFHAGLLLHLPA